MTILKVEFPERLAQEAARMGLLEPESLQSLLGEAIRRRRAAPLTQARRHIAATGVPPLTMEEIQAEIEADRAEQRRKSPN